MHPILFELGPLPIRGYAVAVVLAFVVAGLVRRSEVRRLGYPRDPAHAVVALGAVLGAIVGAKLGMVLFQPFADWWSMLAGVFSLDLTGKTVIGGLAGGYVGVELSKWLAGVRHSTGDGWAVALPLGQAIGRIGCFLEGCCYGTPWDGALSVELGGVHRHPTQLYEAGLDLALAGVLFAMRGRTGAHGQLFRAYLVGYAVIRFCLEPLRGDPARWIGPFTLVQGVCAAAALGFGALILVKAWRRT
jgi:phosphatidylglycerol:prolipoprotein diacylglycerol transferase